jgi:Tol biopolymer transport system component
VAFESFSDDLSTEDDGAHLDVFVRDMQTGTITLVSRRSASEGGGPADGASQDPAISVDGRFVAFESNAANLSTDDDPAVIQDVYVRDLQAQTTTLVGRQSAADGGDGADDTTFDPAISADGRFVAFDTFADNLSAEDTGSRDVFVRDVVAQTTTLVSRESAAPAERRAMGTPSSAASPGTGGSSPSAPSVTTSRPRTSPAATSSSATSTRSPRPSPAARPGPAVRRPTPPRRPR